MSLTRPVSVWPLVAAFFAVVTVSTSVVPTAVAQQPPFALGPPVALSAAEPMRPEVAALPDGTFFATWWSNFSGVPIDGVFTYGQRIAADGTELTEPFSLTEGTGPIPQVVAVDGFGTPVVLFSTVQARAYTASGAPLAAPFPVFTVGFPHSLSLSAGPGGELVAAGSDMNIAYFSRFTADGTIRQEHQQGARSPNSLGVSARAVLLDGGDAVLAVSEFLEDAPRDIHVYRVSVGGDVAAEVFSTTSDGLLKLGALPGGRVLLATADAPGAVTVRVLASDFTVERNLGTLVADAREPDLAVQPAGDGFALAWIDADDRAVVRRFDLEGRPLAPPVRPSLDFPVGDPVPPDEDDRRPRLAFAPNGVLGMVWWREGDAGPLPPVREVRGEVSGDRGFTRRGSVGAFFRAIGATCEAGALCFQANRFTARVTWRDPRSGDTGVGTPIQITDDTGTFWFFDADNLELMVKVLDGRVINDHFWVFYGSLTDVEFELTVTDRLSGRTEIYTNPPFTMASEGDTTAFPETIR